MEKSNVKKAINFCFVIYTIVLSIVCWRLVERTRYSDQQAREYRARYEQASAAISYCRNEVGSVRNELEKDVRGLREVITVLRSISSSVAEMEDYLNSVDNGTWSGDCRVNSGTEYEQSGLNSENFIEAYCTVREIQNATEKQ
jgi:hypothetical protein